MNSPTHAIPEKELLLLAYKTSAALYSMAVKQWAEERATATREAYEDLRKLAEDTRRVCEFDRLEFEMHVAVHGY
jgi:hypothetical protein